MIEREISNRPRISHLEYPEMLVPLKDRVRTAKQRELFVYLEKQVEEIRQELYLGFPQGGERRDEPLPERIVSELLNKIALYAREFSDHYGNYKVGGVLVGLRRPTEEDPNPWVILFDANTRPNNRVRKHCAELYLLDRAEEAVKQNQLERVVALLVVAEPREIQEDPVGLMDDVSKKRQITLTCCALCRERLAGMAQEKSPIVSFESTEVITARSDSENLWIRKFQKVKNLPPFHGEPLPEGVEEIDYLNGNA